MLQHFKDPLSQHSPMLLPGATAGLQLVVSAKRKPAGTVRWISREERRSIVALVLDHGKYIPHVAAQFGISSREVTGILEEHISERENRARREGYLAGIAGNSPMPPQPSIRRRAA